MTTLLLGSRVWAAAPDDDLVIDDEETAAPEAGSEDGSEPDAVDAETPQPTSSKAPESVEEPKPAPRPAVSASVAVGGDGDKKKKRGRTRKMKSCASKPFDVLDCTPDDHQIEIGFATGVFITGKHPGLYDPGSAVGVPTLRRANPNFGFRLFYMPIEYVGIGFESTIMPTVSPSENAMQNTGDATLYTLRGHIAGQLPWRITPTFTMGGGLIAITSDNPVLNSGGGFFYYGPGGKFYVNDWVAVRAEAHDIVATNDRGRVHHGEVLLGVDMTLRVGKWVQHRRARKYRDKDKDGYIDDEDECPNDYGESNGGCPENMDTDHDGTPDKDDRCPEEYGDEPGGCPVPDKDGDGILDDQDSCPDKPEVYNGYDDTDGCPDEEPEEVKQISGVMEGIEFASGKATIKKQSLPIIDKTVDILQRYPQIRLQITGYTDNKGDLADNEALSQRRADAVKDYMVEQGIDESRLQTKGLGPRNPIATNATDDGRAQNRRIEFSRLEDAPPPAKSDRDAL